LFWLLAWRDIKVRYKQTVLGVAWAVLQPLLTMLVFGVFFGRFAGMERTVEGGLPYSVYVFAALLPWQLFASVVAQAGNSLVSSQALITKVYFPRLLLLLAPIGVATVDFLLSFFVLLALMAGYRLVPGAELATLPLLLLMAMAAGLSVGVWLAALNVEFRDVRHAIPFLIQFWMFASPIVYPSAIVPPAWRVWYSLNPMVGVIDGFRWALLGTTAPGASTLLASGAAMVVLLVTGLLYFSHRQRSFADSV
jgi:lipopolysaccharide transport system permease protein